MLDFFPFSLGAACEAFGRYYFFRTQKKLQDGQVGFIPRIEVPLALSPRLDQQPVAVVLILDFHKRVSPPLIVMLPSKGVGGSDR